MKKVINIVIWSFFLFSFFTLGVDAMENNTINNIHVEELFIDVPENDWTTSAIQYVYDNGIMTGKGNGYFGVYDNLTRAEFVTTLYSMSGRPNVSYTDYFDDVLDDQWFTSPIVWAYENVITSGYGNLFGVDDKITREQLVVMLNQYSTVVMGNNDYVEISILEDYPDKNDISSWADSAVEWAVTCGIISGTGEGYINPSGYATRAEAAAILRTFCNVYDKMNSLEILNDIDTEIANIELLFVNADGFVETGDISAVLDEIEQYVETMYMTGYITEYRTDEYSIWMKMTSGMEYVYLPKQKDTDSINIITMQPCLMTYESAMAEYTMLNVDGTAQMISNKIEEYVFSGNYDNQEVTMDSLIDSFKENKIIIWHGHGGYNEKTHSFLQIGEKIPSIGNTENLLYLLRDFQPREDYINGNVVIGRDGSICVTYKFFEENIKSLDNTFIYLGTCSSGKDDVLAKVLLDKGAQAVVANSEIIYTALNVNMINELIEQMLIIDEERYNYYTLLQAYEIALPSVLKNMKEDFELNNNKWEYDGVPLIFGNENYQIMQINYYEEGDGSIDNPYLVSTPAQLNAVRYDLSAHYKQVADIDLSDYDKWIPIGKGHDSLFGSNDESCFVGTYDGGEYSILNLSITDLTDGNAGLFGHCGKTCVIKNINLENANIIISDISENHSYYNGIGAIAAKNFGVIKDCNVNGTIDIKGSIDENYVSVFIGGISGYAQEVVNCENHTVLKINIYGISGIYAGGIVGCTSTTIGSPIEKCINYGDVYVVTDNGVRIGGISGSYGKIDMCDNYGNLNVMSTTDYVWDSSVCVVGGIVANTDSGGNIKECNNYGNLLLSLKDGIIGSAGGIVGNNKATIEKCNNYCESITTSFPIVTSYGVELVGRISGPLNRSGSVKDCYSIFSTLLNGEMVAEEEKGTNTRHGADLGEEEKVISNGEWSLQYGYGADVSGNGIY